MYQVWLSISAERVFEDLSARENKLIIVFVHPSIHSTNISGAFTVA